MRISTQQSEEEAAQVVSDLNHAGYKKIIGKAPKECKTQFKVISGEVFGELPITRVALTPITGRTHQLRVHCASLGHPIVGDQTYGFLGEAAPNGGLEDSVLNKRVPKRATLALQREIDLLVRRKGTQLCLHAKTLFIPHPLTDKPMMFESSPPF